MRTKWALQPVQAVLWDGCPVPGMGTGAIFRNPSESGGSGPQLTRDFFLDIDKQQQKRLPAVPPPAAATLYHHTCASNEHAPVAASDTHRELDEQPASGPATNQREGVANRQLYHHRDQGAAG